MGRARGGTAAQGAAASMRAEVMRPSRGPLAGTLARLDEALNVIGQTPEERDAYLAAVNEKATAKALGRGDRLFIAYDDLMRARQLQGGTPADQLISETMTHNAMWHFGGLVATFDPSSPLHAAIADATRAHGAEHGPAQLDYLAGRGLLDDYDPARVADWRENAADGHAEAFAAKREALTKKGTKRPDWRALNLMYRTARAQEAIAAAAGASSPEVQAISKLADSRAEKVLDRSRKYLSDPYGKNGTSDEVTRTGPEEVSRLEAIAAALTHPAAADLNTVLTDSGALDRHRDIVADAAGSRPATPVFAVSDPRFLDQMMNYSVTATGDATDTVRAVNWEGKAILIAPQDAATAATAGFDEILCHELVHTTQPKAKGSPLADRQHPGAYPVASRHLIFENQLLEGATQALTNSTRQSHEADYDGDVTDIYPVFTNLVSAAAARSGAAEGDFYRELSATPTNQRTGYLARALTGDDSEATQRNLFEPLLNANVQAEIALQRGASTSAVLARHTELVDSVLAANAAPLAQAA